MTGRSRWILGIPDNRYCTYFGTQWACTDRNSVAGLGNAAHVLSYSMARRFAPAALRLNRLKAIRSQPSKVWGLPINQVQYRLHSFKNKPLSAVTAPME